MERVFTERKGVDTLKIGLASYRFVNNDMRFNISQIEKAMKAAQGKADLLCFGEAFLQGFDALSWNYERDKGIAVSINSEVMHLICQLTRQYHVDLLFGYIEACKDSIYSSCAVIENGTLIHNYRRISKGWKEYKITDDHYKEGTDVNTFLYHGRSFMIALCGDLWEYPDKFKTNTPLIWPVYVNFNLEEWKKYEEEYARQAGFAASRTWMVNSLSEKPKSYGGAFCFADGIVEQKAAYGVETILFVEV